MKRILFSIGTISFLLIIGLTVLGCGGSGGSPSSVVKRLYTAFEKGDTKAVNELMEPEAAAMMVMFIEMAKEQAAQTGSITKTEETIDGDTAVVKATFKDGSTDDYDLVKVGGKWKVTIKK
jgi:ketosteroid isomerase-like protein